MEEVRKTTRTVRAAEALFRGYSGVVWVIRFQNEVVDLGLIGTVHVHLPYASLISPWTASGRKSRS